MPKQTPIVISVTELTSYRTCARRWYYTDFLRYGNAGAIQYALQFGTCGHYALADYYSHGRDLKRAIRVFNQHWKIEHDSMEGFYGALWRVEAQEEWYKIREDFGEMMTAYHVFDQEHKMYDQVISTMAEERLFVPLLDYNREPVPGVYLSGQIDLLIEKEKRRSICDHKLYLSTPHLRALEVNEQLTGYCYLEWRRSGTFVDDAFFNVLIKNAPKPPRILKDPTADGQVRLSQDKSQRTTLALYLATIMDLGLDPEPYRDFLDFLQNKGWSQFFFRDGSARNLEQMYSFERRLYRTYLNMREAVNSEDGPDPNPGTWHCDHCPIIDICQMHEEQGDVEYLLESGYITFPPRVKIPKKLYV